MTTQTLVTTTATNFKTPAGQAQYLAAYEKSMAQWPVAYETMAVETSYGTTHLVAAGPQDAPPLVLLHAYGCSLSSWYANIGALAEGRRVYAVDVMGDFNLTVQTKSFKDRAETAQWLRELLDALGIERTVVVGHSNGGWVTLNFALCAPERVEKIVLLAPAASFVPFALQFHVRRMTAYFFADRLAHSFCQWTMARGHVAPETLVEMFTAGLKHYRWSRMPVQPNVYTDDELRRIQTPALLMIGDQEVIYDGTAAVNRAKRLLPNLQTRVVQDASHMLTMEQPDEVNQAIRRFIGDAI